MHRAARRHTMPLDTPYLTGVICRLTDSAYTHDYVGLYFIAEVQLSFGLSLLSAWLLMKIHFHLIHLI